MKREETYLSYSIKKERRKAGIKVFLFIVLTTIIIYRFIFAILLFSSDISITAHRGSTIIAPENTISSVLEAIALNADYIEIDVQLSKDNKVFLLHDKTFKRTAKVKSKASDLTYSQIREINVGAYKADNIGIEIVNYEAPLLEDVIKICALSNTKLNIELKSFSKDDNLADAVVDIIRENEFQDKCLISSYSISLLRKVKSLDSSLKVGLITSSTSMSTYVKNRFVDFYSINYASLRPSIVMYIHSLNKEVHCWTPNNSITIRYAIHSGVDNLITDDIRLSQFLIISH